MRHLSSTMLQNALKIACSVLAVVYLCLNTNSFELSILKNTGLVHRDTTIQSNPGVPLLATRMGLVCTYRVVRDRLISVMDAHGRYSEHSTGARRHASLPQQWRTDADTKRFMLGLFPTVNRDS